MRRGHPFLILATLLALLGGDAARAELRHNPFFYKITAPDTKRTYYVVSVDLTHEEADPLPHWDGIGRAVLARAHAWLIEHYKESYPDIDASKFDEMAKVDDPADGASQTLVVFKDAALTQVAGMLRFAFTDEEHPELPMEKPAGLNWKVPRPEAALADHIFTILGNHPLRRMDVLGDVVEVKNFAAEKALSDEIVPLLFRHAEWHDLNQAPRQYRRYPEAFTRAHPEFGPGGALYTAKYTLMCDTRMKAYYERLGFHVIAGSPTVNGTIGMEIGADEFTSIWFKHFGVRKGAALTIDGDVTYFHYRVTGFDECALLLGAPGQGEMGPALRGLIEDALKTAH